MKAAFASAVLPLYNEVPVGEKYSRYGIPSITGCCVRGVVASPWDAPRSRLAHCRYRSSQSPRGTSTVMATEVSDGATPCTV